jgi:hypothetical protein
MGVFLTQLQQIDAELGEAGDLPERRRPRLWFGRCRLLGRRVAGLGPDTHVSAGDYVSAGGVDDQDKPGQGDLVHVRKYASVVLHRRNLPEVDTSLGARGNDSMDRTAAIADHNGVLDDHPASEIDRHEASAVRINHVGTGLTSAKAGQVGTARVIDLRETAFAVKRTEAHHNTWYSWYCNDCENGEGVIAPQRGVAADEVIVDASCPGRSAQRRQRDRRCNYSFKKPIFHPHPPFLADIPQIPGSREARMAFLSILGNGNPSPCGHEAVETGS